MNIIRRNIYLTSDWHLRHENIIKYCNRPFVNCDEMERIIIRNYRCCVRDIDVVFFLGDIGLYDFKHVKEIISSLPGKKILIRGNHDKWGDTSYYNAGFDVVLQSASMKVGKNIITLGHYPRRTLSEFIRLMILYWKDPNKRAKSFKHKWGRFLREWKKHERPVGSQLHLCGHVHEKWKVNGNNINIGVDVWDFKPVNLNDLINL